MSIAASLRSRKVIILVPLFAIWLIGDLWTKHWADTNLADPRHPLVLRAGPEDVGKTVRELVSRQLGVSPSSDIIDHVVVLPPAQALDPETRVFDRKGPMASMRGIYLFWRGDDLPPRRLNKTEPGAIRHWARAAAPTIDPAALNTGIDQALADLTLRQWLERHLRRLSDADIDRLAVSGIHPIQGPSSRVRPDRLVVADDAFLVEWRRIDVMGDWWKWLYAENPGAAFGFMKQVPETTRDLTFFGLTVVVFFAILLVVARTEERFWAVNIALVGILAGAAGNFVDRIRYGYVIDFIDMHLGFMRWPTYNVADIAITVGVILLVGDILFNKDSPLVAEPAKDEEEATS